MFSRRKKQFAAVLLACCTALMTLTPAQASDEVQFSLETTVAAGGVSRDIVLDDAKNRAYIVVDRGEGTNGAITWLDTTTNQPSTTLWELPAAAPSSLALSPDASKLYVAHYRNSAFSVIDTATGASETFSGIPKFVSGVTVDTDTGAVYVYDSKGLYPVDVATKTVAPLISVSNEKYPSVRDVVYDSQNKVFWIAEARAKILTAFSTQTNAWVQDLALPLASQVFDDVEIGGRPLSLELDTEHHKLYILMRSTLADQWEQDRILTFDTKLRLFVGENFLTVGKNVYDLSVNPATGELYTSNGHDNTVSMISPDTWDERVIVDFNQAGVTAGTGAGAANTWGLATNEAGTSLYVSHPFTDTSRISVLNRSGAVPIFMERPQTPGQTPVVPEETAEPWSGPAAASNAAAAVCAVNVTEPTLSWGVNDYTAAWKIRAREGVTKNEQGEYVWAGGSGWYNPLTGEAQLSWGSGFHIQHYETLVPELVSTWGNPQLTVKADKTATLTMDLYWAVAADTHSEGFKRVPVATFKSVDVMESNGELVIYGEPEWQDRPYTRADGSVAASSWPAEFIDNFDPSMRPWWYASGAAGDANKPPKAIFVGGKVADSVCPRTQELTATVTSAAPGDAVTLTASGFVAGKEVVFELHSDPLQLGTATADAAGVATLQTKVPNAAPAGTHTVVATQADTGLNASLAFTVTAAGGGSTGTGAGNTDGGTDTGNTGGTAAGNQDVPVQPQNPGTASPGQQAKLTADGAKLATADDKLAATGADNTAASLLLAALLFMGASTIVFARSRKLQS